ncbi:MAG: PIN domain-containing protein [Candidatus Poribacteria bacterium]
MEDKTCYCFLDTNTFLHYQTITDINWTEELGVNQIVLVVCPTVIRELNNKKDSDNRDKIRERARNAISKIREIKSGTKIVRPDVELLLLADEPTVDWQKEGLDEKIEDDRIIASIICEQRKNPTLKDNSVIVSSDLGLEIKADRKDIKLHLLSEKYLLPDIKSPEEEELNELRKEIALLKNSLPKLDLSLLIGEKLSKFGHFSLQKYNPLSPMQ